MSQDVEMVEAAVRVRRSPRLQQKAAVISPMGRTPAESHVMPHVVDFVSRATQTEKFTCDRGVQMESERDQLTSAISPIKSCMHNYAARLPDGQTSSVLVACTKRIASNTARTPTVRVNHHRMHSVTSPESLTDELRTPSTDPRRPAALDSQIETSKEHRFLMPTPLMSPSVQRSLKMLAASPVRAKSGQSWGSSTPHINQSRRPMGTASRSTPRRSYAERTRYFDGDSASVQEKISSTRERKPNRHPGSSASAVDSWLADKEKRATAMLKSAMRDIAQRKKQDSVRERRVSWGSICSSPSKRRRVEEISHQPTAGITTKARSSTSSSRSLLMVAAALKAQGQDRPGTPLVAPETAVMQNPTTGLAMELLSPSRSPISSLTRLSLLSPKKERGHTT